MIEGLDDLVNGMQLNDPKCREILKGYSKAESAKTIKRCIVPLEKKHPEYSVYLKEFKEDKDPVQTLENIKMVVGLSASIVDGMKPDLLSLLPDNDETREIVKLAGNIGNLSNSLCKTAKVQENYFIDLTKAIDKVSSKYGVNPPKLFEKTKYLDEITRTVFPTKKEAEKYYKIPVLLMQQLADTVGQCKEFKKKFGMDDDKFSDGLDEIVKKNEIIQAAQKTISKYQYKELDRIYGRKEQ